jgi:hypothetical protein
VAEEGVREFGRLRGRRITSWTGVEMALREESAEGVPQFEDPAVPCRQLLSLDASLDDGSVVRVGTYEDDTRWGLRLHPAAAEYAVGGIYRRRALPELPTGEIGGVSTFVDEGVLAEVVLRIQGRPLLLMAGELYESGKGPLLSFVRLDESVLAFTDPSAADSVAWVPARRRRAAAARNVDAH